MGRRVAFLIASQHFRPDSGLSLLRGPLNDVTALANVLGDPNRGAFDVRTFVNASSGQIKAAIDEELGSAGPGDLVLIHYAGHGKLDRNGGLCLATSDTRAGALQATSIPTRHIKEFVSNSDCDSVVLILDCCYSGVATLPTRSDLESQLISLEDSSGFYILSASSDVQTASESEIDGVTFGQFSAALVEGISSGAADVDEDGRILLRDLFHYARGVVKHQSPKLYAARAGGDPLISRSPATAFRKDAERQRLEAARQKAAEDAERQKLEAARQKAAEDAKRQKLEAARQKAAEDAKRQKLEAARQKAAEDAKRQKLEAVPGKEHSLPEEPGVAVTVRGRSLKRFAFMASAALVVLCAIAAGYIPDYLKSNIANLPPRSAPLVPEKSPGTTAGSGAGQPSPMTESQLPIPPEDNTSQTSPTQHAPAGKKTLEEPISSALSLLQISVPGGDAQWTTASCGISAKTYIAKIENGNLIWNSRDGDVDVERVDLANDNLLWTTTIQSQHITGSAEQAGTVWSYQRDNGKLLVRRNGKTAFSLIYCR